MSFDDAVTEVTPEMIEAGARLIGDHFYDVTDASSRLTRDLAEEVYQAMWKAKPKQKASA